MVKTTKAIVELPEHINQKVEVYKAVHKCINKGEAIVGMLEQVDVQFSSNE